MGYIKINGVTFDADVAISKYTRYFNVLDGENAGRVMTGRMVRDIIGSYLGHKITVFRRGDNQRGLDEFWDYLFQHSVDHPCLQIRIIQRVQLLRVTAQIKEHVAVLEGVAEGCIGKTAGNGDLHDLGTLSKGEGTADFCVCQFFW